MSISKARIAATTSDNSLWQWREWQGLPYLTCDLLENWQHGFFTQQYYPRLPEELVTIFNDKAEAYRVKQVHGNRVLTPQEIATAPQEQDFDYPNADGIITDKTNQGVWVASADCNPVLIGDRKTGRVAAIHAGWRGTAQKIVPNAIASLQANGSELRDLVIAMGAAISGEMYQVSETVAMEVGSSILEQEEQEQILNSLLARENSPLLQDEQPGRVKLDIRRVNQIQLEQLGIGKEQIAIAPHCTYQEPEYFFSYRRTKQKKVQWSGIISN